MTVTEKFNRLVAEARLAWPQVGGRVRIAHGQLALWWGLNHRGASDFEIVVQLEQNLRASMRLHVADGRIDRTEVLLGLAQVLPFVRKFLEQLEVDLKLGAVLFEDRLAWKKAAFKFSPVRALGALPSEQGDDHV